MLNMQEQNQQQIKAIEFFSKMSDEDLIQIHDVGQLESLCTALSLDLQYVEESKLD